MGIMDFMRVTTPYLIGACVVLWGAIILVWLFLTVRSKLRKGLKLKNNKGAVISNGLKTIGGNNDIDE